jgi:hypothetical protein
VVDLASKATIADFGPAVYTTPDLQYALDYAATYICNATRQPEAVVFDVPQANLTGLEQLNLSMDAEEWVTVVKACRTSSMSRLKKDQVALYSKFTSADFVSGAITANATNSECRHRPRPERWQQFAFRTDRCVEALLKSPCRVLIWFAYPPSWN